MSDPTRSDARENACDPVSIDAVAAVIQQWTGQAAASSGREWGPWPAAQALAAAGWLRTAEDRAVLDAAEAETAAEEALEPISTHSLDYAPLHTRVCVTGAERRRAVRARRVAAGGTVPADPPAAPKALLDRLRMYSAAQGNTVVVRTEDMRLAMQIMERRDV